MTQVLPNSSEGINDYLDSKVKIMINSLVITEVIVKF